MLEIKNTLTEIKNDFDDNISRLAMLSNESVNHIHQQNFQKSM